jgi:pimeloyl-ACP methyl ester carboxylesterase
MNEFLDSANGKFAKKSVPIFLPGIGGNELLFAKQKIAFPQAQVPMWLKPRPKENLREYVQRWSPDWATGSVLVGMSFGGMVALEMARHFPVRAVVLISSLWDKSVIDRQFVLLEQASRLVPNAALRPILQTFGPRAVKRRNQLSPEDESRLRQMAGEVDLDFARWACRAVISWDGALDLVDKPDFKLIAVHGAKDPVIRLPSRIPDWLHLVEDGRHFLPYSHPDLVNAMVQQALLWVP